MNWRVACPVVLAAFFVVFGAAAPLAFAAEGSGGDVVDIPEGAVATVNGEPISREAWLEIMTEVAGDRVLDVMIRRKIVEQAARRQGIEVTDAELQSIIDRQAAEIGGMNELVNRLSQMGETLEDYRDRLYTETLLRKMVEPQVTVSEEEVEQFFREKYGRKARVQVIVTATRADAENLLKRARAGEDFAALAEENSIDPVTVRNNGYLPLPLSEGMWPKSVGEVHITEEMGEEIFSLRTAQVSDVIKGPRGNFYLFRLGRRVEAADVKLEDVRDEIREEAREAKLQQAEQDKLQELLDRAVIKRGI